MNNIVTITYCVPCGYIKRAQLAADALKEKLGVEAELIQGKGGVFKVAVDGNIVTERTRTYFPNADEIVAIVEKNL